LGRVGGEALRRETGHDLAARRRVLQTSCELWFLSRVRGVLQSECNFPWTDTGDHHGTNRTGGEERSHSGCFGRSGILGKRVSNFRWLGQQPWSSALSRGGADG